jgi:hypothetical protein
MEQIIQCVTINYSDNQTEKEKKHTGQVVYMQQKFKDYYCPLFPFSVVQNFTTNIFIIQTFYFLDNILKTVYNKSCVYYAFIFMYVRYIHIWFFKQI